MNHENSRETDQSVADHYAALTDSIVKYNGADLLAVHYGLWGPDTSTERESMLRANSTLVRGCDLRQGQRVLDAGCGVGGTAIWLAETYRVHVTGLTICEPHIAVAAEHAQQRGVGHLVEFRYGDFMNMPFPDATFDVVLNHESFCYVPDRLAYFQGVRRVLKPGGRWQALDGFLSGVSMSETQEEIIAGVERNFHIPPMISWRDLVATLEKGGFEGIQAQDLTSEVMPSTENARKQWKLFVLMTPPNLVAPFHDFQWATAALDAGLREGILTYRLMSGATPVSGPEAA